MQNPTPNDETVSKTPKPSKISLILKFLEHSYVSGTPATWSDFKKQCPALLKPISTKEEKKWSDMLHVGYKKWSIIHSQDEQARTWFNNIRLGPGKGAKAGGSKISQVLRFLDNQYTIRAPATWTDFKKQCPALSSPCSTEEIKKWSDMYHKGVQKWAITHSQDAQATSWFDNTRPGPSKGTEQVHLFFDWQCAANAPAAWRDLHRIAPHISYKTYNSSSNEWRDLKASDAKRLLWYENVANLKIKEVAQRYLDWQCAANVPAPWSDFHKRAPQISRRWFDQYTWRWREAHKGDAKAIHWFDKLRPGRINATEMVRRYLDWQCAANLPATRREFHQLTPTISGITFNNYSRWWRDNYAKNPTVTKWYDEVRLGRFNGKILARYVEWQCAASAPANWADFHSRYPMGKYNDFMKYCYKWRDTHLKDSEALQWFNEVRRAPSRRKQVIKWLDEQYSAGKSGWYWLFIQQNEDYSYQEFNGGRGAWENGHKGDKNALTWGKQYKFGSTRAHRIGHLFEQSLISVLHNDLKKRGISLYYNTTSIAALGRTKGHFDKHSRRVEGRLFNSDLLAPQGNIGPDLREFLMKSGRPQLALDVTLGDNVGRKITLYADDVTGLLVITPWGNGGQRQLEAHVRVLSIAELAGPRWFNCDPATRAELDRIVEEAFEALKGGPDSAAWQRLQAGATQKWQAVSDDIKVRGSQAEYRARVANDVASYLRRGEMPKELAAYARTARAAGHVEHADRAEGLVQAVAALVRHSNEQKSPAREIIAKGGGETTANPDILPMVEEHMRYLARLDREDAEERAGSMPEPQDPVQMVEEHMRYLASLDREDAEKNDGNTPDNQDPVQMVEEHTRYLEDLDREDAEQVEGAPEADADAGVDQGNDQSNPPDTMEAGDAMPEESPEDEDEEDAEDDHEDFV